MIDEPFVNYQERMTRAMKELTKKGHDMVSISNVSLTASEGQRSSTLLLITVNIVLLERSFKDISLCIF